MSYLNPVTFSGKHDGPALLILGAVHGNEPCGHIAIGKILKLFENGELEIESGCVTFIQTCNPKAFEQKIRYVESNLNRRLFPKNNPKTYEDKIANELCPFLEQADLLLDLHSYRRGGPAFGFMSPEQTEQELKLLKYSGVSYGVYAFAEAYAKANINVDEKDAMGTREYLLSQGGYGITLECGQHDALESIDVASNAILNVLKGFGFINNDSSPLPSNNFKLIEMKHVFYKEEDGLLSKNWSNFESISKNKVIATYENGNKISSPCDGIIVLPDTRPDMPIGEEWLYIGKIKNY